MAQGSEQLTWKRLGYPPRVCATCGRELVLERVARVDFGNQGEVTLGCTDCDKVRVRAVIERFWDRAARRGTL